MEKQIEELIKEIGELKKRIERAHQAIDDFQKGFYQMGFGPLVQSDIIAGCNARLAAIKDELKNLGMSEEEADNLCKEPPPDGSVFKACMDFIAKHST